MAWCLSFQLLLKGFNERRHMCEFVYLKLEPTFKLVLTAVGGLEDEHCMITGQCSDIPVPHPEIVGIIHDVDQAQIGHVPILMGRMVIDDKDIAGPDGVSFVSYGVEPRTCRHDHKF